MAGPPTARSHGSSGGTVGRGGRVGAGCGAGHGTGEGSTIARCTAAPAGAASVTTGITATAPASAPTDRHLPTAHRRGARCLRTRTSRERSVIAAPGFAGRRADAPPGPCAGTRSWGSRLARPERGRRTHVPAVGGAGRPRRATPAARQLPLLSRESVASRMGSLQAALPGEFYTDDAHWA